MELHLPITAYLSRSAVLIMMLSTHPLEVLAKHCGNWHSVQISNRFLKILHIDHSAVPTLTECVVWALGLDSVARMDINVFNQPRDA